MQPPQQSRIDIAELKARMMKKIGPRKSKQYFCYLNLFLSQKLKKNEFDKLCIRVLGRDNLLLHNQFVFSILKNACNSKTPGSSLPHEAAGPVNCVSSNGVILPISPKKIRSRKLRDRPGQLLSNGKAENTPHHSTSVVQNGNITLSDNQRRPSYSVHRPMGSLRVIESFEGQLPLHSKDQIQIPTSENIANAEQEDPFSKTPLLAPLGIPFCSASIGGSHKFPQMESNSNYNSYYDSGGLYDAETLKIRMEHIALSQGLSGVSSSCAFILNYMLDLYLKQFIKSGVDLARNSQPNLVNGAESAATWKECRTSSVCLRDFKVAMELNPQQLGENWPLLLEKLSMYASDE